MKDNGQIWRRIFIAAMVIIAALFCCTAAGAEPAPDITKNCKFNAGSGRKTFSKCKDRDYKTYWKTNNGDKCYVEVTVPAGQSASGVMVQWYEHPHAWGVQVKDESGTWTDAGHTDGSYLAEYLPLPEGTTVFRVANAPGEKRHFNMTELRIYGEGKETTMNPKTRSLLRVVLPDAKNEQEQEEAAFTSEIVKQLMGNNPELRFKYIQEHAKFVENLDI